MFELLGQRDNYKAAEPCGLDLKHQGLQQGFMQHELRIEGIGSRRTLGRDARWDARVFAIISSDSN